MIGAYIRLPILVKKGDTSLDDAFIIFIFFHELLSIIDQVIPNLALYEILLQNGKKPLAE